MSTNVTKERCFTFIWKIENASYCLQKKGEAIQSPTIEVDELEKTRWTLKIYPRGDTSGNDFSYFIKRENDSTDVSIKRVKNEFDFLAKDGSVLESSGKYEAYVRKIKDVGYNKYLKREEVFVTKRSSYLPQDTLTARCRIWKIIGEMSQDVCCIARTRIGVEKRSFLWKIEKFSKLELGKKCKYLIKSVVNGRDLVSLDLSASYSLDGEEIILIEFTILDETIKFCSFRLFIIDASGNKVQGNQDEFWAENLPKCKQFIFCFTTEELMAKNSMYLLDDVLSLHWEWAFSKGVVLEEIEEVQKGYITWDSKISGAQNNGNEETLSSSNPLKDNLKSLWNEKFLSDVKLKTSTSEFAAHKLILSASSSVFKAMFSRDMKEKNSNFVDILDLQDDAVSGMLHYIYTTRVEDLTWEKASHLYVAADKYAISSLKNICSSYLKVNFSPTNACEVLLLSDLHADSDLKCAVQDYILKHAKDIVNSDEWKLLMEANLKLAAETLCLQYK